MKGSEVLLAKVFLLGSVPEWECVAAQALGKGAQKRALAGLVDLALN